MFIDIFHLPDKIERNSIFNDYNDGVKSHHLVLMKFFFDEMVFQIYWSVSALNWSFWLKNYY